MAKTKRNPDSLFSAVVNFINDVPVGTTYRTRDLRDATDGIEIVTAYKRWNNNPSERTLKYQTMLKRGGFVKNVKRGEWQVLLHVPEWFTLSHLNVIIGYPDAGYTQHGTDPVTGRYIYKSYNRLKMTKEEILTLLTETQLRQEYPANVEGSKEFIEANSTPETESPFHDLATALSNRLLSSAADTRALTDSYMRPVAAVKISPEESQFFNRANSSKEKDQLMENLRENIGLITAAVNIVDQIQILDPLVQGRVVNIYHQLKALQETVGGRIEYNRTQPNLNI
jgi:hypothetical protein